MASHSDFLQQLLEMGFPENRAQKALVLTHSSGVEPALTWLVRHAEDPDIDAPLPEPPAGHADIAQGIASQAPVLGFPSGDLPQTSAAPPVVLHPGGEQSTATAISAETKMVLVVAAVLGMGAGKTAAQAAHAAVGLYKAMQLNAVPWLPAWEVGPVSFSSGFQNTTAVCGSIVGLLKGMRLRLQETGEKTVVLSAPDSAALEELQRQAFEHSLPTFLVADAGRTEVAPGAVTCLGIAGVSEAVDRVTGHLRTLR